MSRGIRLASSSLVSMRRVFCRDRQSYGLEEILNFPHNPKIKRQAQEQSCACLFLFLQGFTLQGFRG